MCSLATALGVPMEDRIRLITHKGKAILLVDASHCSAAELLKLSRMVPLYVMPEPRGSVLLLADFTGAEFDREAITSMKESRFSIGPISKSRRG